MVIKEKINANIQLTLKKSLSILNLQNKKEKGVSLKVNCNFAGDRVERENTSGSCQLR